MPLGGVGKRERERVRGRKGHEGEKISKKGNPSFLFRSAVTSSKHSHKHASIRESGKNSFHLLENGGERDSLRLVKTIIRHHESDFCGFSL